MKILLSMLGAVVAVCAIYAISTYSAKRSTQDTKDIERAMELARALENVAPPATQGVEQQAGSDPPSYPTLKSAGTEKIFYLEEPDRGPVVSAVVLPRRSSLRWRKSAHCESDVLGIVCSAIVGGRWQLGYRRKELIQAERWSGGRAQEIFFFVRNKGRIRAITKLDGRKVILWTRFFADDKDRFSARALTGANSLAGCGNMAFRKKGTRLEELTCLQWMGKPMRDTRGVFRRRFIHDEAGFVEQELHLDLDGKPAADNDGVHRVVFTRDNVGRPLEQRYMGLDGQPVRSTTHGCFALKRVYNERGNLLRQSCLGEKDESIPNGRGVHTKFFEYDKNGCQHLMRFAGPRNKPIASHQGTFAERYQRDAFCAVRSKECLGDDDQLVRCGPGIAARFVIARDKRGFVVSTEHFDEEGHTTKHASYDAFEIRLKNDARGNAVELGCYSTNGEKIECKGMGFHMKRERVDHAGRAVESRFFDVKGKQVTNLGCAIRRRRFDNYDHRHETLELNEKGQPIEKWGLARWRSLYDVSHRLFAVLLFNKKGSPARYHGCFGGLACPSKNWH
ncbi:MAG: hypothetical protein JRH20_31940, partial [Deltaproteobacteria bacterium]|nr:hypothetical protein [Deltaproteobacteria bacterium]